MGMKMCYAYCTGKNWQYFWISFFNKPFGNELISVTAQKRKFSIEDFFSKRDQIRSFLQIWSHLLKKTLSENFIFCAVSHPHVPRVSPFSRSLLTRTFQKLDITKTAFTCSKSTIYLFIYTLC